MQDRIQLFSILAAVVLLGVILELVRRKRLMERYALVWIFSGLAVLGLAIWRGALAGLSDRLGIAYPPNALFLIAFGFVLVLLLNFSVAISRLSDQSKVLAQNVSLLDERLRNLEGEERTSEAAEPAVLERRS